MSTSENSYDHPKNIRLLLKLGIISPATDIGDVFQMWGSLISDPVIWEKGIAMNRGVIFPGMAEIVATMTPAEKIALRDRVCGVAEMPERQ